MGNALGTQPAVAPLLKARHQSVARAHYEPAKESASLVEEMMIQFGGALTLEEMRVEITSLQSACASLRADIIGR